MAKNSFYVGLLHYPVLNKQRQKVTTSITNIDIHDISRLCCSFGVRKYLLINPLKSQKMLYDKIIDFWRSDTGKNYQPDRAEALEKTVFVDSYEKAVEYVKNQEDASPFVITTTAKTRKNQLSYDSFNSVINKDKPVLLIFGTGYGLAEDIHTQADYILSPIESRSGYNHLSVRSAVAIVLDRLIPKNK